MIRLSKTDKSTILRYPNIIHYDPSLSYPCYSLFSTLTLTADDRPNVLFIAVDDLNHWVSHLGRNSQAKTPNIDRLAAMGTTFTNAHTAVPACEPSRCALMSGRRPWVSGCYKNGHEWRKYQKPGEGLSAQFLQAGYYVSGAGKIYHQMDVLNEEWSDYMSARNFFSNGPGVDKYDGYHVEKTFPDLKDEDIVDWHSVDYCVERLSKKRKKPYFIACGLYKPHLAFVAPRKYYEDFPLDEIKLPPHIENDLDDIPPAGIKMAKPQADHARVFKKRTMESRDSVVPCDLCLHRHECGQTSRCL